MKIFINKSTRDEKLSYLSDLDYDIKSLQRSIISLNIDPLTIFERQSKRNHRKDIANRILKRLIERYNRVTKSLFMEEHSYSMYECDSCEIKKPLVQDKIKAKKTYIEPHGCHGGDFHSHDYYYYDCECGRPVEVDSRDINFSKKIPKVTEGEHGRGRCTKNIRNLKVTDYERPN